MCDEPRVTGLWLTKPTDGEPARVYIPLHKEDGDRLRQDLVWKRHLDLMHLAHGQVPTTLSRT